ncbi:isochorismatase family protein [Acidiphilium acidophilum]|uniref:Isochorismatase family protein n=1 Tax=Acidiphilium acidophilum TaxID=76588 RepID=A0AAW9DVH7_ACIAO|nr:isochorismatase family protein [Acidiphilium acidophilum]MDX5932150.1 isochorismatase family protein [Acidiphilium acidophilum]GBQ31543.1 isochorismatase hydrolase [Acidiphilium acidophilum DSM 700]
MALTVLDPNSALIVVDLQKGIVERSLVHPVGGVVERARALADAFRARGLPVVLVNVTGGAPGRTEQPRPALPGGAGWADLVAELGRRDSDILVTKRSWGAFATTDLDARLKALGVTQVVIAGIATATGVEATARQAYELGFNVTLAIDAMTDMRAGAHDYSIANVFPRLGETGVTRDVIALLDAREGGS